MSCSEIEELIEIGSVFNPKNSNSMVKNLINELKEIKKENKNLEKQISDINKKFSDQITEINNNFSDQISEINNNFSDQITEISILLEKQRDEFQNQINIQSDIIEKQKESFLISLEKIKNENDLQIKKLQEEQMKSLDNPIQKSKNEKEEMFHVSPKKRIYEINVEPQKNQITTIGVPLLFKPLVETMKSIGKSMISVSDIEPLLMKYYDENNMPQANTNAYLSKASDARIIIYDRSINYVRFKNRSFMNADIEYV